MIVISNTTRLLLPSLKLKKIIWTVLDKESFIPKFVSAIYCGDKRIRTINTKFLNHDYSTDTISFRLNDGVEVEGEFYISLDTVMRNAKYYKVSFLNELARVTIHSTLHLIGYKDKSAKDKMEIRAKEAFYLNFFSFSNSIVAN